MKMTIVCDVLGEENNGTTIAAFNLIRGMRARGHEVRVVCPDDGARHDDSYYLVSKKNLWPFNGYFKKNGVALAKADRHILKDAVNGADVVHIMLPFSLGKAAVRLCGEMNIPVTAGFHAQAENFSAHLNMSGFEPLNHAFYRYNWNNFYKYVDLIHYPTKFIKDVFENSIGYYPEGVIISNGVDHAFTENRANRKSERSGKFTILCTGRYSNEKKQSVLIDALSLSRHRENLRAVFAGDGPLREKLVARAEKTGADATFAFFSRRELLEVISSADLYVHTAEIEIEAIACLEAIAGGLVPLIADSPKSATKDYALSPDNLFEYNDPASLAEKIDFWYEHPEKAEYNAALYEGFTKEIDHEVCMGKMERMLTDAAARGDFYRRAVFPERNPAR